MMRLKNVILLAGQQVVVKIRIMSLTDLSTAGKLQIFIVHAFGMMWLV